MHKVVVLALLSLALPPSAAQTNINIGLLVRLTDSAGTDLGDVGRSWAAGALLAVKHFNTRNASFVTAFGSLASCNVQLVVQTQV